MRKLTLSLDALSVESFHPAPTPRERRGTVEGQQYNTLQYSCYIDECNKQAYTNAYTCPNTCRYTCGCDFSYYCSALC